MIGDTFKNLKNYYTEIKVPESEIDEKWQTLSKNLPEQKLQKRFYHFVPYGVTFAGTFILLLIVIIGVAQSAKPNSPLYPIHMVTQEVAKEVTGTFQPKQNYVTPPTITTQMTHPKVLPTPRVSITPTPQLKQFKNQHSSFNNNSINNSAGSKVLGSHTGKQNSKEDMPATYIHKSNNYSHGNSGNSNDRNKDSDSN